jgi:hypothetical protein
MPICSPDMNLIGEQMDMNLNGEQMGMSLIGKQILPSNLVDG